MSTPTPRTDTEITFSALYTCTHHNDKERATCPVCLVASLTAERDQLRAEVERLKTCGITELAAINPSVLEYCKHWEARAERAEAERDALSKVKARLINALEHYENCVIAGGKNPARDAIAAAMKEDAK